jgi:hypothetical protein
LDRQELLFALVGYLLELRPEDLLRPLTATVDVGTNPLEGASRSLLTTFALIVNRTGTAIPYLNGDTYATAIATFVPRFLWEDKPLTAIGNFIGQRYGFLPLGDEITNIAPSQMGEAYMNFGVLGLVIAMSLWGLLARYVDERLCGEEPSWVPVYFFTMVTFQESPIGHSVVPVLKLFATLALTLALIAVVRDCARRLAFLAGRASAGPSKSASDVTSR